MRFRARPLTYAAVAQSVEQLICNQQAGSSILSSGLHSRFGKRSASVVRRTVESIRPSDREGSILDRIILKGMDGRANESDATAFHPSPSREPRRSARPVVSNGSVDSIITCCSQCFGAPIGPWTF